MEIKKTPKADLETKKALFFDIGLVTVLALLLVAFEWTTGEINVETFGPLIVENVESEEMPVTRQEEQKTPPPPPPPAQVVEQLEIVKNDTEIEKELDLASTESNEKAVVQIVEMPAEASDVEEEIFFVVEEMPEFPGGQLALRKFIADNVEYPEIARENEIQGRVFVQFVVNEKGDVVNAKVVRGVDPALDKAALKVINSLPRWKPGKQRDKPAKVSFTVPINFMLAK